MIETSKQFFRTMTCLPVWQQFHLVPSHITALGSIFNFSEYLAAVALFLVVITVSDFRYSYRLSLTKTNLRKLGFWIALSIGVAILVIDIWYDNELPVPKLISNPNNLKAILGFAFLGFVFRAISVAVISPPVFSKSNATRFFEVHYHLIHQGNVDRLQIIAEEVRLSVKSIVELASKLSIARGHNESIEKVPQEQARANDFLLLIGDERFCKVVVDRGFQKEFYALQAAVLRWTKTHYRSLMADHPKVAETCLQGSISYDSSNHRLVKTYSRDTEREPHFEYLNVDSPM